MSKPFMNPFARQNEAASESTDNLVDSARRDVEEMFSRSRQSLDDGSISDFSAPPSPTLRGRGSGPGGYAALSREDQSLQPLPLQSNPYNTGSRTIGSHRASPSLQLENQPYDPPSVYQPPPSEGQGYTPSHSRNASQAQSNTGSPNLQPTAYEPYTGQSRSFGSPYLGVEGGSGAQTPGATGFKHTVTLVIGADGSGVVTHSRQPSASSIGSSTPLLNPQKDGERVESSATLVAPTLDELPKDGEKSEGAGAGKMCPKMAAMAAAKKAAGDSGSNSETKPLVLAEKADAGGAPPAKPKGCPFRGPPTALSKTYQRMLLTICTIAGFFGPLAGTIYLPALPVLAKDFGVGITEIDVTVSVFMFGFAFFPLIWATYADWKGRRPLYLISLAIYIVANVLLAVVPANYAVLIILRIVQSFGSAAVVSMGAGTIADVFDPKKRGKIMSIFLLGPQCGPILGPLLGGLLAGQAHWRWIFAFLAISAFVLWLVILFFMPETLRARVGNHAMYPSTPKPFFPPKLALPRAPESERGGAPPKPKLRNYWNLMKYMPIGIVSINTALLYGTYFAMTVLFPIDISSRYDWSITAIGAALVPSGIFLIIGSLAGGRFSDYRRRTAITALKLSAMEKGEDPDAVKVPPENRLLDQTWGLAVYCIGVVAYGWLIEYDVHVVAVIAATCLIGFGNSWVFVMTTTFLSEIAPRQAAVAFALGNMLRNPAAALAAVLIFPVTSRIGNGWAFSALAIFNFFFVSYGILVLRMGTFRHKPAGPPPPAAKK